MQLLIEFPVVKKHILGTSCLKQQTVYMTLGIAPGKMNDQADEYANIGPFRFLKVQLKKGKGTEEEKVAVEQEVATGKQMCLSLRVSLFLLFHLHL